MRSLGSLGLIAFGLLKMPTLVNSAAPLTSSIRSFYFSRSLAQFLQLMAASAFSSTRPLLLLKLQPTPLHHSSRLIFPSKLNPSLPPLLRSTTFRSPRRSAVVASAQSNFFKVIQTAWRIGKDGIEAGTNLIPDSVPRPLARISVAVVCVTVGLFLLRSFISTAFFVLAMMGFIYFVFIAFNKDEDPKGGNGDGGGGGSSGSSPSTDDEALEEVRRIMEKYK